MTDRIGRTTPLWEIDCASSRGTVAELVLDSLCVLTVRSGLRISSHGVSEPRMHPRIKVPDRLCENVAILYCYSAVTITVSTQLDVREQVSIYTPEWGIIECAEQGGGQKHRLNNLSLGVPAAPPERVARSTRAEVR